MVSYTNSLGIELQVTGTNSGTWGTKTNNNFELFEQAIAGYQDVSIAGGAQTTALAMSDATISNARNAVIKLSGTITGNQIVTIPNSIEKVYIISNETSGAHTVQFKTVSGTGYTFAAADKTKRVLYSDGTNIVDTGIVTTASTDTLSNKTFSGTITNSGTIVGGGVSAVTLTKPKFADAGFIADSNGNEQIIFQETASAVNELEITNAATGNAPNLSATGGDSNIDINISPKGYGRATFNGQGKIQGVAEKVTTEATAATGTINYDVLTQAVWNFTSDAAANWTLNVRGDGSTSLDSIMDTGESLTIAHIVKMGSTPYYNSAFQIDGSSVTPEWQGGSAPTSGNASSLDVYTYTIIKTGSATFTALASQAQFA